MAAAGGGSRNICRRNHNSSPSTSPDKMVWLQSCRKTLCVCVLGKEKQSLSRGPCDGGCAGGLVLVLEGSEGCKCVGEEGAEEAEEALLLESSRCTAGVGSCMRAHTHTNTVSAWPGSA